MMPSSTASTAVPRTRGTALHRQVRQLVVGVVTVPQVPHRSIYLCREGISPPVSSPPWSTPSTKSCGTVEPRRNSLKSLRALVPLGVEAGRCWGGTLARWFHVFHGGSTDVPHPRGTSFWCDHGLMDGPTSAVPYEPAPRGAVEAWHRKCEWVGRGARRGDVVRITAEAGLRTIACRGAACRNRPPLASSE